MIDVLRDDASRFQSTPPSGERSDGFSFGSITCRGRFQSTPPSGERSDGGIHSDSSGATMFQSTPPSGERSDLFSYVKRRARAAVSIHAPLRREERRGRVSSVTLPGGFNPRPPPERGATCPRRLFIGTGSLFQSTPPSGERSDDTTGSF